MHKYLSIELGYTMTLRELHDLLSRFVADHPGHESLDRRVVMRVSVDPDLHCGGLDSASVDAGCTEEYSLVLDGSDSPDEEGSPPQRGEHPVTVRLCAHKISSYDPPCGRTVRAEIVSSPDSLSSDIDGQPVCGIHARFWRSRGFVVREKTKRSRSTTDKNR